MDRANCRIDKLSFVHIPKTAGLSLHAELEKYFGAENSIRIQNQEDRALFSNMTQKQLEQYSYITGHISVGELTRRGINYPIISVLREPVRRLISLQHYLTNSDHKEHLGINFENIEVLLQNMFNKKEFNLQCWHLCEKENFELAVESIRKNNIFVVPLEYYQDLIETLSGLLGTPLSNISINVTQYKAEVGAINLKHDLLEPIIGEDIKLFSYVKQNYENLKHAFIQSVMR